MENKLFKALDEVVAWFKKEGTVVESDIHLALTMLYSKHGPVQILEEEKHEETPAQ